MTFIQSICSFLVALLGLMQVNAPAVASGVDKHLANLMVVLRETEGANKADPQLRPSGKQTATLSDGQQVKFTPAWFDLIGDMHIRFVFDGPESMEGLSSEELKSFGLSPDEAVRVAVKNIERVYGEPKVVPGADGLMSVEGKSPDLNSSYFLDESFWKSILKQHPEGLIVAVPRRGGLFFAPASDLATVDRLSKGIGKVYASSGAMRVSSALYVFKAGRWSVFQAPVPKK